MDEARMCLFADVDDPRVSFPFGPLQLPSGAKKVLPSRPTSMSAVVLPEAEAARDEREQERHPELADVDAYHIPHLGRSDQEFCSPHHRAIGLRRRRGQHIIGTVEVLRQAD
jgi:hypothetical protein